MKECLGPEVIALTEFASAPWLHNHTVSSSKVVSLTFFACVLKSSVTGKLDLSDQTRGSLSLILIYQYRSKWPQSSYFIQNLSKSVLFGLKFWHFPSKSTENSLGLSSIPDLQSSCPSGFVCVSPWPEIRLHPANQANVAGSPTCGNRRAQRNPCSSWPFSLSTLFVQIAHRYR